MHTAVSNVIPLAPPTPAPARASPVLGSPVMSSPEASPAARHMRVGPVILPEPVFVHGVDTPFSPVRAPLAYPAPSTPSPRALLAPVVLEDFEELMMG
jgi:hypothetical protein